MTPKEVGFYPRVLLSFIKLTDANLTLFVRNVVTLMTGNTSYPTPMPSLASVTTLANELDTLAEQALSRDRLVIAQRNEKRSQLETAMRQLAAYVTSACNSDVLTLLTSGFEAVKVPSPVGVLNPPSNPNLSYTRLTGELLFRFTAVPNAKNYSIELAENAEGAWKDRGLYTSSRVVLNGLVSGKTYWARARAHGTAGPSDWSGPATLMAI